MNSQILICFGGNEEDVLNAENNEEYFIFLAFIKLAIKMLNFPKVLTERERSRGKSCHVFSLGKLQRQTNRISLKNSSETVCIPLSRRMAQLLPLGTETGKSFRIFQLTQQNAYKKNLSNVRLQITTSLNFSIFTTAQGFYSLVARESSRPKSCRPKPETCCPKFLVMSPEKKSQA